MSTSRRRLEHLQRDLDDPGSQRARHGTGLRSATRTMPGPAPPRAWCRCPRRPPRSPCPAPRPAPARDRSGSRQGRSPSIAATGPRGRSASTARCRARLRSPAPSSGSTSHPRSRTRPARSGSSVTTATEPTAGHEVAAASASRANAVTRARRTSSGKPVSRDLARVRVLTGTTRAKGVPEPDPDVDMGIADDPASGSRVCAVREGSEVELARQRELDQKRGWAFTTAVALVKPTLLALTKREWHDGLKIPAAGGCVVAMNHLSHADPLTYAHFIYDHGRIVRYLAKQEVFEMPFVKTIAVNAGQIPVARLSGDASKSFDAAVEAVREGQLVAFYPEGTITRDPDLWPMRGKTGAARVALEHRLSGDPDRPVGRAGPAPAVRQAGPVPAQDDQGQGRRPGRPRRPAGRPAHQRRAAGGDRTDHGRDHRAWWRTSAGSRRRPSGSTRARPGCDRPATRTVGRSASEARDEQGGGVRRGVVGHRVLDDPGRRRQRRHDLGPARGRVRHDQRQAREHRLPARHRAAADDRRRRTTRSRPCPGPSSWCSPYRPRRCARTSPRGPT